MGVGLGHMRFCARTRDPDLIAALTALDGTVYDHETDNEPDQEALLHA